ncbi:J domain-containing protein [Aspergillus fijiensis CBS 313.89]|uniref:J domain-containing protein n=1 Tax=Aspergillus fijiensis CBS 313.89 TaxID=1448319 RepID=A0A8G1S3C7_9EURO|nr:uncharacterized protein BO72DRAFT_444260 [Aspergillus fijiensis CBS 313.89]RAK81741.1 hypothetical protein BO72DRAFT_444260 [Aspergillus fijiensis CBS 313.89]
MDMRKIALSPTVSLGGYFTSSSTQRRSFALASMQSVHGRSDSSNNSASPLWPSTADDLTPYRILGLQPGEPYRKSAFYERAKLYHPDRHRAVPSGLAPAIRASRYRMVVAAHELLSDPHKREAYDRSGVGWKWGVTAAPQTTAGGARRTYTYTYASQRPSGPGPGPAGVGAGASADASDYSNATTAADRNPPALRFFRTRSGLLLVVVILVFFQSCLFIVQYNKAQLRACQVHRHCQRLLERRRTRAGNLAALPAAQLERFLLNRDPSGMGLTGVERYVYRDVLPTCAHGPV